MKADTLARLRSVARGDFAAVSGGDGVTVTPAVTPKKPEVTPVTPVTPKNDERGKATAEGADAVDERAALAAGRVPSVYLDAWARLNHQKPYGVSEPEWRLALDDGGRFLDVCGKEAAALGWTPGELFDVTAGLIWRLAGERVEAIDAYRVRLSDGRTIARGSLSDD